MIWRVSSRSDPRAVALADRHYSRQTPGSDRFMPPGGDCVLRADHDGVTVGVWGVSVQREEFVDHAWAGAWVCTIYRREPAAPWLASDGILQALAATRAILGDPPALGMISFVAPACIEHKRTPGLCFRRAGFRHVGETQIKKHLVYQLLPAGWPEAEPPLHSTYRLF